MIIPNYVPDPLEVPQNMTEEPYLGRLAFIRRVTYFHLMGIAAVVCLTHFSWPSLGWEVPVGVLFAIVVGLDFWRIYLRGSKIEGQVSAWFLPVIILLAGWTAREAIRLGFPMVAPTAGVVCATIYTLACGRDFSFVGCTVLSQIGSAVVIAAFAVRDGFDGPRAAFALALNAAYLFYLEYDLASLLARRRRGEEFAAVVDLYRDIFNIFGYVIRVWKHWQKYRIWEAGR